jgi:FixJ family two-component response regulator
VDAQDLVDSVEEALDRSAKDRTRRARREVLAARIATLTARERQVFELVVCGRLNKQIAWEFGVGEKTIKVHRARVKRKMGAQTLAQLVHMADELRAATSEIPERATAADERGGNVRAHTAPLRPASKSFATTAS